MLLHMGNRPCCEIEIET